ncbi:hypothetical protein BW12_09180 [Bifidobacterium sp. UTCIF-3]|uniref:hypothetical protein n=1 Tax=unclassified Bifidobacterium TaxID=2608897 RepID=UPI00112D5884|nr:MULTISPECIES: hypothetical protein [unclassified Bifidobacterium]TPF80094.1 hypothetical protein BW08_06130 [Bifidobacterium sp. UTCIF-24]TPF81542.1 hypothetical protein BW12_09180 [Bifidobacterium sp. UTCIF-3]TPF83751.1 hypothetical protein BW07_08340 [Bifidobacterium sp. UTCIF-36]
MSDTKSEYSAASKRYLEDVVPQSPMEQERVRKAKERESLYNDDWIKQSVNLNDVIEIFAPKSVWRKKGYKYKYVGRDYIVLADMIAGYLRIIDRHSSEFVKLDGTPGTDPETHFKILKRKDM